MIGTETLLPQLSCEGNFLRIRQVGGNYYPVERAIPFLDLEILQLSNKSVEREQEKDINNPKSAKTLCNSPRHFEDGGA